MTSKQNLPTIEHSLSIKKARPVKTLQKRIDALKNEMAFLDILVQFWPWTNMAEKLHRLERKFAQLHQQYSGAQSEGSHLLANSHQSNQTNQEEQEILSYHLSSHVEDISSKALSEGKPSTEKTEKATDTSSHLMEILPLEEELMANLEKLFPVRKMSYAVSFQ